MTDDRPGVTGQGQDLRFAPIEDMGRLGLSQGGLGGPARHASRSSERRWRRRWRLPFVGRIPFIGDLLVAQGLPIIAQTFVGLLTAATLGPSGKGIASLAVTVASLGGATLFLSLHVGVVHAFHKGDRQAALRGVLIVAVIAVIPLVVGLATGIAGAGPRSSTREEALFLGLAAIIFDAPALLIMRSIQGLGDARAYRTATLIRVVVYATAILALAVRHLTPGDVVAAFIAADIVTLVYAGRALQVCLASDVPRPERKRTRILGRSLVAHLAVISQQASYRTDIILLGIFATSANLGQYAVATAITEALWIVSEAISLSVFATTARQQVGRDRGAVRETLRDAIRADLAACAVGAVVVGAISYPVLWDFFPAYRPAFLLVLLLLPGIVVGGVARLITYSAIAAGRQNMVRVSAAVSIFLVPVYVPLILMASAKGAALASDLIYFIMVGSLVFFERRSRASEATVGVGVGVGH